MKQDETPDKLQGIAAILAAIHPSLWLTFIGLLLSFIVTSIILNIGAIPHFVNSTLVLLGYSVDVAIGLTILRIAYAFWEKWHAANYKMVKLRQAKAILNGTVLKNDMMVTKIREREFIPLLVRSALQSGQNVEMEGLKVSNYLSNLHTIMPNGGNQMMIGPALQLSAKCEMIEVARRHDFTVDNVVLGIGRGDRDLCTSIESYVHCANDGSTGSGKTANGKGQLVQFIKAGVDCILVNPHFTPTTKRGEDWKPIARALSEQPLIDNGLPRVLTQFPNIGSCLEWAATVEIDRRFEMMRVGDFSFKPLYLYIDEWPSIVSNCKNASDYLRTILQRGRAVEVCVFVNSQGFLQNDTDLQGSARENFDTSFFLGGSTYSGAKLLDVSEAYLKEEIKKLSEPLGKGVGFMRNISAQPDMDVVRIPLITNDFVYYVLGRADDYVHPQEVTLATSIGDVSSKDSDIVHGAINTLRDMGEKVTVDKVTELVPWSRGKVGQLMKQLKESGYEL